MRDLSAPLRVTWEVPADPELAALLWRRLGEGRVLFVEAQLSAEVVESFAAALGAGVGGVKVTVCGGADVLVRLKELLPSGVLQKLEAVVLPPFPAVSAIKELAGIYSSLTLGLWSTSEGMDSWAPALELAEKAGVKTVSVMNPAAPAAALGEEERGRAVDLYKSGYMAGEITPRVHDLFLSDGMGLDPWKGYAGCAAAGSLAHLQADGLLTACRTHPTELGSLKDDDLKTIWGSPRRVTVREELSSRSPAGCVGCTLLPTCKGGCPGLAGDDGRDCSCAGPREG